MKIYIQILTGKDFKVEVEASDLIYDVKINFLINLRDIV